jgi:hypothetical protein
LGRRGLRLPKFEHDFRSVRVAIGPEKYGQRQPIVFDTQASLAELAGRIDVIAEVLACCFVKTEGASPILDDCHRRACPGNGRDNGRRRRVDVTSGVSATLEAQSRRRAE